MQKLPPTSADKPIALDAISGHARSLRDVDPEAIRNRLHADICSNRQIEIQDQKLRTFVIKHSVVQIHCVVVVALILVAAKLLGPVRVQVSGDVLTAFMIIAAVTIAASTRSIGRVIAHSRR